MASQEVEMDELSNKNERRPFATHYSLLAIGFIASILVPPLRDHPSLRAAFGMVEGIGRDRGLRLLIDQGSGPTIV
jgi:hypothetical protein